jgi:hypothetical protein
MISQTVQMLVGVMVALSIFVVSLVLFTGGIDASNESKPQCQLIDSNLRAMYFTRFCKSGDLPGFTGPLVAIGQTVNNKFDGAPRMGVNLSPRELYKLACVVRCQESDQEFDQRMP